MHSWTLLRKHTPTIRLIATQTLNIRTIFTRPNNLPKASFSSTLYRAKCNGYEKDFSGRVVSSWVAILCSSCLGICYTTSLSGHDSNVCFADSGCETADEPAKKSTFLFNDTYRKRVFFKYEKRLRIRSPPEKVFEYFASYRAPNGELFMTASDLMRAVVPVFPPSESEATIVRGGYLKGEWAKEELHIPHSSFFLLFDTNNDGILSFPEYIFFVTLLSIPESSFSVAFKMFDLDGNGKIDKQEFKKVMALMRSQHRQGTRHRDGLRTGLKVSGSVEDGGLVEYFFGKDANGSLDHAKFVEFLRDLHNEILRLEFAHYDCKGQGTISAADFALSMVASADISHISRFLDRIDELVKEPQLKDLRITFEEFKTFAELRKSLEPFSVAIFSYGKVNGLLTKQDLQRAAKQVCGISITDNIVDMIYYIFDVNLDGSLSSEEFLRALERRETDISGPNDRGSRGFHSFCSKIS
ncbi:hypothetical protein Leryth_024443 [Lithospermum erythrorhizon]|nr:hypothetical protein Leryth_024443 [Lithospermum erythrorhizon]